MHKLKSMLLTVFCTGIILGTGYFGITEIGRQVLERETTLEEASYESTSSNIFYGKIEEDIELFPWNYYPGEGEAEASHPVYLWGEEVGEGPENAQNWYISMLIACETGTSADEVYNWYLENQKNVSQSLVTVEDSFVGYLYFYQDILDLRGKQYQVRLALNDWDVLSFICTEYHAQPENRRERTEWETGKEKLVAMLEQSEDRMTEYFSYMTQLQNLRLYGYVENDEYVNAIQESLYWLEETMALQTNKEEEEAYNTVTEQETNAAASSSETEKMEISDSLEMWVNMKIESGKYDDEVYMEQGENSSYSYQIVELKDMILLLMQGETTIGIYYDPVEQKFCGYNYFTEN